MEKLIVHVDMDAFFAAIEQRDNPELRGRAVVVGADPKAGKGRGVVSTCSYEARRFGIHSAMPISAAYKRCPDAAYLPVDIPKYSRVSRQIYKILYEFTPDIEPVGIDEAFLDITGSFHLFKTPLNTCLLLKAGIKEKTGLTASLGLAPTKTAAKIASDLKKPDGMVEVKPEGLLDFLWPLEIRRLWGLGAKTEQILNGMGIYTIGELAKKDIGELTAALGKNGEELRKLANGIDERAVSPAGEAKSISNETTFEKDSNDTQMIKAQLLLLCEEVSGRLRAGGLKGRTITLKIRLEGFQTYTRAITIDRAINFVDSIYKEIIVLYDNFDKRNKRVRLVGVRVSGLCLAAQRDSLFGDDAEKEIESIHKAVDRIRQRFGGEAIHRAGSVTKRTER